MTHQASSPTPADTPLWTPSPARAQGSQMADFAAKLGWEGDYAALWRRSVTEPEAFWSAVWDFCGVIGEKGETVLKDADQMPGAQFFPQARLNYAENLLRRRDDAPALIFRAEPGDERIISFRELYEDASRWAQAFAAAGVQAGDRVAAVMPNMPETIGAMLGAASLGAVWSSASPDFGAQGLLDRFGQIAPKVLVAVDGYFYNGKTIDCRKKIRETGARIPGLERVVVVPFLNLDAVETGTPMADFLAPFAPQDIAFNRVPFNHPLFILFSSGTTGVPKCIVHGHGGTLVQHLKEHRLQCDTGPGDRVFYFTTCGWMMWNWLVSALACEAALLLFDGSPFYPDGLMLWDFAERHGCTLFGTSAKYIDALKNGGVRPGDSCALETVRTITSTGSPLVHESFDFVYDAIKKDVLLAPIYGGTDVICASFGIGNPLSPVWRGEMQGPALATAIDIFDENGCPIPPGGGCGELVLTRPIPSMPVGFWDDPDGARYRAAYFETYPNVWRHGDWAEWTAHHGLIVHGRSDATLNPGGVRIGTAEIYRQVEQFPEIAESIAVGQDWDNDVRVVLFVRLQDEAALTDDLKDRIKKAIRAGASPRHVPAKIIAMADIPRTKSGKITELAVRDVIHGRPVKNVEALANPEALKLYEGLPELNPEA